MVPGQEREIKMKKCIILILFCTLVLFGCGNDNTNLGSEKGQSCAKQAVETITQYCDGAFTYERAEKTLEKLSNDMNYVSGDTDEANNPNHYADFNIHTAILGAYNDLVYDNFKNDAESYKQLQEDLEDLNKYIDN